MPDHRTHDIIGILTAVPMTAGVYTSTWIYTNNIDTTVYVAGVFCVSHLFSTIFLSPDMDIDSRIYRRWGILRVLWYPYQRIISHRSIFSHSIIGGIVRMLIILIWLAILAMLGGKETIDMAMGLALANPIYILAVLLGSASASGMHVLADNTTKALAWVVSALKGA